MSEENIWAEKMAASSSGICTSYVYNFASCPSAWEYKWVRPGELSPRIMDSLGKLGWEYVGCLGGDWAIFKRPLPAEAMEGTA